MYFRPPAANLSAFGVWQGPPKALGAPNPASSMRMISTFGDLSSEKLVKQAKGKVRRKCLFTLCHGDSLFHFAFLLCPILLFASFCERSALWLRLRRATLTIRDRAHQFVIE